MFGDDIGTLMVHVRTGEEEKMEWGQTGNQGNSWHEAQIDFSAAYSFRVSEEYLQYVR